MRSVKDRQRQQEEDEKQRQEEEIVRKLLSSDVNNTIQQLQASTVRTLIMSHMKLDSAQIRLLAKALYENATCKTLILAHMRLKDDDGVTIAHILRFNRSIERLDCGGNRFASKTMKALGEVLPSNKWIRSISLASNDLSEKGFIGIFEEFIQRAFTCSTLEYLNLNQCHLEAEAGESIMKALETNYNLKAVDLCGNGIAKQFMPKIEALLSRNRGQFQQIKMAEKNELGCMAQEDLLGLDQRRLRQEEFRIMSDERERNRLQDIAEVPVAEQDPILSQVCDEPEVKQEVIEKVVPLKKPASKHSKGNKAPTEKKRKP